MKNICVCVCVCMIILSKIYCEIRAMKKKNIDFNGGVIGKLLKGLLQINKIIVSTLLCWMHCEEWVSLGN